MSLDILVLVLVTIFVVAVICYALTLIPGAPSWMVRFGQLIVIVIGVIVVMNRLGYAAQLAVG